MSRRGCWPRSPESHHRSAHATGYSHEIRRGSRPIRSPRREGKAPPSLLVPRATTSADDERLQPNQVLGLAAPTSDSESLGLTGGGLEPRGGDKSPPPLSDYKKIDCSAYATSRSLEGIFFESLTKNIEYFASTTKTKITVPPNKCFQVGCWEDVGVWWCNDVRTPPLWMLSSDRQDRMAKCGRREDN